MYLKSLEIQGFKSFANKIVFQFHNGITGVVGPNGSGKSNVSDAIRWVLGEQSAKSLRGGSMQDVIFAGTEKRKPMSFAYVAITFDNADHALPVDYEEVTIGRRLYRSGESEYSLNGTACRMRDIQELIMDTGIGQEGYSLIGQGQVEKILNGRPEERRELFDEAAGIVKFKHRKADAVKKLDEGQQNLTRVADILSELNRQIGPLQKQSETAKEYLSKRDRLKVLDASLFMMESDRSKGQIQEAESKLQISREEQAEIQEKLSKAKEQYEELDSSLTGLNETISQVTEEQTLARLERQKAESEQKLAGEQIQSLENSDRDLGSRLETLSNEKKNREQQLQAAEARFKALSADAEALAGENESAASKLDELSEKISAKQAEIDGVKSAVLTLLNERTDIQSGRERAGATLEQLSVRESQLQAEELKLLSEQKENSGALEEISGKLSENVQSEEKLNQKSEELAARLESVQKEFLDSSDRLSKMQEDFHRESARLETLRAITERYEGYGQSIRRVMEQRSREPGILGVVADLIKTEKRYEIAIETALGGSIQNIVTDDEATAKRMIAFLKENRFGRATFLPLTAVKNRNPFRENGALEAQGVIGLASTLVQAEDRFRALADSLLGRTVVCDNIDTAIALARSYHYSLRIVTLDGELLSPGGSMTGGAFKSSSNLLGRRREIDDLERNARRRQNALDQLQQKTEELHTERNTLRQQIAETGDLLKEVRYSRSTLDMRQKDAEAKKSETERTRDAIQAERERIARTKAELEDTAASGDSRLELSARKENELKERADALTKEFESLTAEEKGEREKLQNVQVRMASRAQEETFLKQNRERLISEICEREEESERIRTQRTDINESIQEKKDELERAQERISSAAQKETDIGGRVEKLEEQRSQMTEERKKFFGQREELSRHDSLLDKEIFRLEEQLKKLEEAREARISELWEEYELTPSQCAEMKLEDAGSYSALKKNIADLKKEIRALGPVNVNAIDEYKEQYERQQFLTAQHDDIVKSQEALNKVIEELDEGMRRQFKEQFARIQTEFNFAFRELFGGGKGTLELVDDEDVLTAGIRVIAQPPGKKLQNMMQLSGGEKSLTAIALLFAIQNLKPSPFCLLDEIESALDENNVERYAKYLHKLTKHTQFIIITHRRGSMAAADRLYGITMQEKGVSALVSVDLVQDELT